MMFRRMMVFFFFFSSRRRHTRLQGDWSSDVCSSDLGGVHDRLTALEKHMESLRNALEGNQGIGVRDRKSTRLNSSHLVISYAVFCLKKKKKKKPILNSTTNMTTSTPIHVQ